jgi:hypothetical protein
MSKNFKSVKASLIMGILLVSVFAAMVPTTSAGKIIALSGLVDVNWTQDVAPIIPTRGRQSVPLTITYTVSAGAIFASAIYTLLQGRQATIHLEVIAKPDWCSISLDTSTVSMILPEKPGVPASKDITATISVTDDAPAFDQGVITIRATADAVGPIDGYTKDFDLKLQPDYLALINPQPLESNTKTIGPTDKAVFPFEIMNMGNAPTKVYIEIVYIPDGWTASVTDSVTLDAEKGSKATAYLTVYPPKGFGYHDDKATVKLQLTPAYAQGTEIKGEPEPLTFTIESRGVSLIGIEVALPIILIILVIIIVIYMFFIKKYLRK